jgi:alpha-mannosidase
VLGRDQGKLRILFEPYQVPAMGVASFAVEPDEVEKSALTASEGLLENDFFRVEIDARGEIVRLLDKRAGREVIPAGTCANLWQLFQDGPEREAAWNVHDTFEKRQYPISGEATVHVHESGPVRASLRVERTHRQTRMAFEVILYRRTPRIDFVADVDWQERQTMLKIAFPVAVRSPAATYEVQFGAVQRPTHQNTSWDQQKFEVAAQRWADLSEAGYGVSLLNDSRYGYDVKGNVLRLTALRSPEYPDPEADRGSHCFAYALLPHLGGWEEGETVYRAREFNEPMAALPVASPSGAPLGAHSYLQVEGRGVVMETLKPAEDGNGWILRLYEATGGRGPIAVRCAHPIASAAACNLVEEPGEAVDVAGGEIASYIHPYEIKTYRLHF